MCHLLPHLFKEAYDLPSKTLLTYHYAAKACNSIWSMKSFEYIQYIAWTHDKIERVCEKIKLMNSAKIDHLV